VCVCVCVCVSLLLRVFPMNCEHRSSTHSLRSVAFHAVLKTSTVSVYVYRLELTLRCRFSNPAFFHRCARHFAIVLPSCAPLQLWPPAMQRELHRRPRTRVARPHTDSKPMTHDTSLYSTHSKFEFIELANQEHARLSTRSFVTRTHVGATRAKPQLR
jgi:hypothetical protein